MSLDTEIRPLSREALKGFLHDRQLTGPDEHAAAQRRAPRWPFAWPVELWVPNDRGHEEYALGTCRNLSVGGVGVSTDGPLSAGQEVPIAIHQPEMSFHGRAVVRHCRKTPGGYYVGLEFVFAGE